jgi:hypothetical protein
MANEAIYYMTVGFQLGILVSKMVVGSDPAEHPREVFDCLDRIARGELTPIESDAELRRQFPDEPNIGEARRQNQEMFQTAAQAVILARNKLADYPEHEGDEGEDEDGE